jgi:CDP-diacylglycerol--glycerol-3-phosphate 3-phosphatidyltransferase
MTGKLSFRWLPNAISMSRLLSVPVLLTLAMKGAQPVFAALLFLALVSDLVDGWLARRWSVVSKYGALLDSVADIAITLTILASAWILHPNVYEQDGWVIYSLLAAWLLAHSASLLRYGRLASFHTWLIRIGIATFNVFALILFTLGYYPWLLYLSASLSLLGVLEHFALLALLREWSPDIPGGLPEILRQRAAANKARNICKENPEK